MLPLSFLQSGASQSARLCSTVSHLPKRRGWLARLASFCQVPTRTGRGLYFWRRCRQRGPEVIFIHDPIPADHKCRGVEPFQAGRIGKMRIPDEGEIHLTAWKSNEK
jgi:hypothetical protein